MTKNVNVTIHTNALGIRPRKQPPYGSNSTEVMGKGQKTKGGLISLILGFQIVSIVKHVGPSPIPHHSASLYPNFVSCVTFFTHSWPASSSLDLAALS